MLEQDKTSAEKQDYSYIIHIIQYLEVKYHINLFISSKDFDVLYRWWEKRIPLPVIKESIHDVIQRWQLKGKKITGFSNFNYEVSKNFKVFMEMKVGKGETATVESPPFTEIDAFFKDYPPELEELREPLEAVFARIRRGDNVNLDEIYDQLLLLFGDNSTLRMKTELFLRHLSPELNNPEIVRRYKINYLLNRFHIPDFELYDHGQ